MRTEPYTEEEIVKEPCYRCGKPATEQWQICADMNIYRPICIECDIKLNKVVLRFVKDPDRKNKIKEYARKMRG